MRRRGSHAAPLHPIEPHCLSARVPGLSIHAIRGKPSWCLVVIPTESGVIVGRHSPEGNGGHRHARTSRGFDIVL
jgi:hypothetical protein